MNGSELCEQTYGQDIVKQTQYELKCKVASVYFLFAQQLVLWQRSMAVENGVKLDPL